MMLILFCAQKMFNIKLSELDVIFFAIIYHDIIYKPLKKDNEEKSAQFFIDKVATPLKLELAFSKKVCDAILSTKHNEGSKKFWNNNEDIQLLLDLDLSIFKTENLDRY